MARPIVLSNGDMHVGINNFGLLHDLYFPYVGLENHTLGHGTRHRIGVWVDGAFSWLDDGSWRINFDYPHDALIGNIRAVNDSLQLMLELDDAVDYELSAFMRSIHVINLADRERDIRVFLHQAFVIGDSRGNTDTAQYLPDSHAIVHYRGRRTFVVSAESNEEAFDQHSIGLFGIEGREGTYKDAEDGELSGANVEHGRVDSVLRFRFAMEARGSRRVSYHIAAGTTFREALKINETIKTESIASRLYQTANWWQQWLEPALQTAKPLSPARRKQFIISVMVLKSHIDNRGAVIASTDTAMLNYGRDAYAYTWPRDTAYILWPLIRLGYTDEPRIAFDFYRRGLHSSGYFSHKYRADGAIGSSWHPYVHADGITAAPIQTDETAIMLFMFTQFYRTNRKPEILEEYYESFVKPMADFLTSYIDPHTLLPRPSYDLWEERFMTTTYTTAATYAALSSAAELADEANDSESAVSWRAVADDIKINASYLLYSDDRSCVVKGFLKRASGEYDVDNTIDVSAAFGAFMFELFAVDSSEVVQSFETIRATFNQSHEIGLPRYENDMYGRTQGQTTSNYWPVTTLWCAQYFIERGDFGAARQIISWVEEHSYETGIIAEQIRPCDGYSTSVAPLTWSHAEYVATILDLLGSKEAKDHL